MTQMQGDRRTVCLRVQVELNSARLVGWHGCLSNSKEKKLKQKCNQFVPIRANSGGGGKRKKRQVELLGATPGCTD